MMSYEIWLVGGGSLNGTMSNEDAYRLKDRKRNQETYPVFSYKDEDGDDVTIDVRQIAVFAFRPTEEKKEIGFPVDYSVKFNYLPGIRGDMNVRGDTEDQATALTEILHSGDKGEVQEESIRTDPEGG